MRQEDLVALVGESDTQYSSDTHSRADAIDEIPDEYPLPDFVVPSVIQGFLDRQEEQRAASNVAFTVR